MKIQKLRKKSTDIASVTNELINITIAGELIEEDLKRHSESAEYRLALLNLLIAKFLKKIVELGLADKTQSEDIEYIIQDYLERDFTEPLPLFTDEFDFEDLEIF